MTITTKLIVLGLGMVLVAGTLGFDWADALFPSAEAHDVQAQLQSRFVRIENETFNTQSMQTGEILTVQGRLVSLVERDLRAWVSIFFESESEYTRDRWEVVDRDPPGGVFDIAAGDYPPYMTPLDSRDPPGGVFDIAGNSVVPYTVSARALHEGVYHAHTQLNVATVGPGLGPGATVVVEGEPIARPGGASEDLLLIIVAGVILGGIVAAFVIKARLGGGGVPRQHLHTHDTHTIWDTLRTIGGVMVRPTRTFEHIRDFDHYYLPRAACVTATVLILGSVAGAERLRAEITEHTSNYITYAESLSGLAGTATLGVPLPAFIGLGVLVEVCFLTLAWYVGKRMGGNANWRKVFAVLMYTNAALLAPAMLDVFDVYVGIPHYEFGADMAVEATFFIWYVIILVFAMRSVNRFGTWRALKAIILASLPIMALVIVVVVLVVMWQLSRSLIFQML